MRLIIPTNNQRDRIVAIIRRDRGKDATQISDDRQMVEDIICVLNDPDERPNIVAFEGDDDHPIFIGGEL